MNWSRHTAEADERLTSIADRHLERSRTARSEQLISDDEIADVDGVSERGTAAYHIEQRAHVDTVRLHGTTLLTLGVFALKPLAVALNRCEKLAQVYFEVGQQLVRVVL